MHSAIAATVAPDETAFDVLQKCRRSRLHRGGTGCACLDAHLRLGHLAADELVVLHGEVGSAKSALLRNVLGYYLSSSAFGGQGLPVVLIDADATFDVLMLAQLIRARVERGLTKLKLQEEEERHHQQPTTAHASSSSSSSCAPPQLEAIVQEAISRLLVLRPREPADLLRQLSRLRTLLSANPTASLIIVDSMSAWQSLSQGFPRSTTAILRESWRALLRLQREHCVSVVASLRAFRQVNRSDCDFSREPVSAVGSFCCHLRVARSPNLESFVVSILGDQVQNSADAKATYFGLSAAGEIINLMHGQS